MKSWQVKKYGANFSSVECEVPQAGPGLVLIKVHAACVNPFDLTLRSGAMAKMIKLSLPFTTGGDFAGIEVASGREVYGTASVAGGGSGSMAEYALAKTTKIAQKPKSLSWSEAASMPLAGVSALQAIEEHLDIKSGQKILIQGGVGGIGTLAIQLAKKRGAYVSTTARGSDEALLSRLGADLVLDYKNVDFRNIISEYEAVFDTVGGEITSKSLAVIKPGGKLVTMIGEIDEKLAQEKQIVAIRQQTKVTSERLATLSKRLETQTLQPVIDKIFSFEQVGEAYDYFENEHPRGKVVVEMTR